jgi:threonyl-tRNA synthetase
VLFLLVGGEREAAAHNVSLRMLRGEKNQTISLETLLAMLKAEPLPA